MSEIDNKIDYKAELKKDIDGIFIDFFPPYKRQQRRIG